MVTTQFVIYCGEFPVVCPEQSEIFLGRGIKTVKMFLQQQHPSSSNTQNNHDLTNTRNINLKNLYFSLAALKYTESKGNVHQQAFVFFYVIHRHPSDI